MGCECGAPWTWDENLGKLVCSNPEHRKIAPFQPMPADYVQVLTERNYLYRAITEISDLLQGEAKAAHTNAEIQLVVDEALKPYQTHQG